MKKCKLYPSTKQKKSKRDIDEFDHYFDHLLVVDHNKPGKIHDKVVGTYRLNGGNHKDKENFFIHQENMTYQN